MLTLGIGMIAGLCGWLWFKDVRREVPEVKDIYSLLPAHPSHLLSIDGHVLAGPKLTQSSSLDELPPMLIAAFLAAEDEDYFSHPAYNIRGILRAAWSNYRQQERAQGASTITQQLARRFLTREKTYRRKVIELLLAKRMEALYSKPEILHVYLESVFLGHRAEGVTQAADRYFAKTPQELSLSEMATLAGIAPAPSIYNPRKSIEKATQRRRRVLRRMRELGMISSAEEDKASAEPVIVRRRKPLDPTLNNTAIRIANEQLEEKGWFEGGYTLVSGVNIDLQKRAHSKVFSGVENLDKRQGWRAELGRVAVGKEGLLLDRLKDQKGPIKVALLTNVEKSLLTINTGHSNFDLSLADTKWAEDAKKDRHFKRPIFLKSFDDILEKGNLVYVNEETKELLQFPVFESALLLADTHTGRVLSHVGAIDPERDAFDRSLQGCRQPGSVFKPVVYTEALHQNLHAATMLSDVPVELSTGRGGVWRPRNADRNFRGYMTLANALAASRNIPVARLMDYLGAGRVVQRAKKLGIRSPINASSSASLGANCTRPFEVARVYTAFQRKGWPIDVHAIGSLRHQNDIIVDHFSFADPEWQTDILLSRIAAPKHLPERGTSEKNAYIIQRLLRRVVTRGTAHDLPKNWLVAGKTGTTNKYDAWFAGFDGELTTIVWVGSDKNTIPLGRGEHGATVALPIFAAFYKPFARTKSESDIFFLNDALLGVEDLRIDPQTGLLAHNNQYGETYPFDSDYAPTEMAPSVGTKQAQNIDELLYDF